MIREHCTITWQQNRRCSVLTPVITFYHVYNSRIVITIAGNLTVPHILNTTHKYAHNSGIMTINNMVIVTCDKHWCKVRINRPGMI